MNLYTFVMQENDGREVRTEMFAPNMDRAIQVAEIFDVLTADRELIAIEETH